MDFLPLFFNLNNASTLVVGSGDSAARKVELLLKAGANVNLCAKQPVNSIQVLIDSAQITVVGSAFVSTLLDNIVLVVVATAEQELDDQIVALAKARNLPVNVVNYADKSTFIFPSIIDRSPIIVAASSSGSLPVLTRLLRSRLESTIPQSFGRLAELAGNYRTQVKNKFSDVNQRRKFWEHHLEGLFAEKVFSGNESESKKIIESSLSDDEFTPEGEIYLVGAGSGDADLLTFKALRLMRQADIVLFDHLVSPEILDLVRSDAERVEVGKETDNNAVPPQEVNNLMVTLAKQGKRVLRLKSGNPFISGCKGGDVDHLADEGISFQVVPGVTETASL